MFNERDEKDSKWGPVPKGHKRIHSSRYAIPIDLPEGIYNMIARISANSLTPAKERHEASQKYYEALKRATEESAKLTPEERRLRDEKHEQVKQKEMAKEREKTLKAMAKFEARQEKTRQEYFERYGPPIVLKGPDPKDPQVQAFNRDMEDLFGPIDEDKI